MPATAYRKNNGRAYPRKSPAQQLETAIAKCEAEHITVTGSGTLTTGAKFWIVPSQSVEGMSHIVTQASNKQLTCDCYAGQRGIVCIHRAACFLVLKSQAAQATKAVAAAALPTVKQPAQPVKVSPEFQKRIDSTIFPSAARPVAANDEDPWGRYQHARMDEAVYVPADYKSHEYR